MRILLILLVFVAACNPYNKLDTRPPMTAKDSLALAARCDQTFSTEPIYIEGETMVDTVFLETPVDIDLGEADSVLEQAGYNLDSLKKAWRKDCNPKEIHKYRVDTLKIPDSLAYFNANSKLQIATRMAAEKIVELDKLKKKTEKFSMYKFAFYAWPIWIILCIVLYILARNNWRLPAFNLIRKFV